MNDKTGDQTLRYGECAVCHGALTEGHNCNLPVVTTEEVHEMMKSIALRKEAHAKFCPAVQLSEKDCTCGLQLRRNIEELKEQLLAAQASIKLTYKVVIAQMKETHRITYWVVLLRSDRPANATFLDNEGKLTPYMSEEIDNVRLEAAEWAKFLGTTVEEYIDESDGTD